MLDQLLPVFTHVGVTLPKIDVEEEALSKYSSLSYTFSQANIKIYIEGQREKTTGKIVLLVTL